MTIFQTGCLSKIKRFLKALKKQMRFMQCYSYMNKVQEQLSRNVHLQNLCA